MAAAALCVALAACPAAASGRQEPPAGGASASLSGRVLDAVTGGPVREASVTLEPLPAGLLVDDGSAPVRVRSVWTGEDGAYRFEGVAPGRYRLRVERLGYRAAGLEVEVRRPVDVRVSLGLRLDPVALEPVRVEARAASLFERATNRPLEVEDARIQAERARQALFLTPDSRMLTWADVMDAVTLGEGDVFRALQRFPGVGTRDDYTAELWTRGAPWTHTRVTFDGVPLFNPVHAVGILSAVTPEVLGAVFFHPGVRPAGVADGAAGVVDLRTRPGGGKGEVRGVADLSMASAKVALDQNLGGRAAWVVAARRSHLDVLSGGLGWLGLDTLDLPYVFHDVAGRADVQLGARARLEASGLREQDRVEGDVRGVLERTEARWGNTAGRVTLVTTAREFEVSHTLASSRFEARTDERLVRTRTPAPAWTESASRNEIRYTEIVGELTAPAAAGGAVAAAGAPARWVLGYHFVHRDVAYDGPWPRYHPVTPDTIRRLSYRRELRTAGLRGELRIPAGARLVVSPGVRVETGAAVAGAPSVRASPRISARWTASGDHSLSVAAGRSWQLVQAIALAGPSFHPAFHASHFWVAADEDTPPIRADVVSLGSEHWLGDGWLGSVTVFLRRASGVALPDPTPGPLLERERLLLVTAGTRSRGLELGLRRIGARWSASFGYAWGVSEAEVGGRRYPAPADRRHMVDALAGVRVLPEVRVAAAYTAMSGAPFTRAVSRAPGDCVLFGFGCDTAFPHVQEPNAERTPAYRSLDVSLHWGRALGPTHLTAYLQVRNVLGRDNASTYSGSVPLARTVFEDRFEAGLPRVPLAGLRLTF